MAQERLVDLVDLVDLVELVRLGIPRPQLGAERMRRGRHLERRESRLELPPVQFVRFAPA